MSSAAAVIGAHSFFIWAGSHKKGETAKAERVSARIVERVFQWTAHNLISTIAFCHLCFDKIQIS